MNAIVPNEEEQSLRSSESQLTQKKSIFNCSLSVFLILTISLLILFCSLSVYLSIFIGLYSSIDELSTKVVSHVQDKITGHIDGLLGNLKIVSTQGASHYNNGLLPKNKFRNYLLNAYNNTGVFVALAFYFAPVSERFGVVIIGDKYFYSHQDDGFQGVKRDWVSLQDFSTIQDDYVVDYNVANVSKQSFYYQTVAETNRLGVEGVFSGPYFTIGGPICIPYNTKLYDPVQYELGKKDLVGVFRASIPLFLFTDFLKQVKVFERGYILVKEYGNTNSISGSIKTTTPDGTYTLPVFNITDRNVGQLMLDLNSTYGKLDDLPSKIYFSSLGVRYIVTSKIYTYDTIKWTLFVVVYEEDISLTTTISISSSVAVTLIIIAISIIYGLFLSRMITNPVLFLKKQLGFIKLFDLENVRLSNSIFKEMNEILADLGSTVKWLKEIKSFVPDTVFYQMRNEIDSILEVQEGIEKKPQVDESRISASTSKYGSNMNSSNKSSNDDPRGLFKLGLSKKCCSILQLSLYEFDLVNTIENIEVSLPKIMTSIKSVAKLYQANLQINSNEEIILIFEHKSGAKKHVSALAMECALKLSKGLTNMKTHDNMSDLDFRIGISTSERSYAGNMGTNHFRFYSFVSNSTQVAKNLCSLAYELDLKIVIDDVTENGAKNQFITRPIDRIQVDGLIYSNDKQKISSVFELVRENAVEMDEWMYELENKNVNSEIESLKGILEIFSENSNPLQKFPIHIQILRDYLAKHPTDKSYIKLLKVSEELYSKCSEEEDGKLISNYCTIFKKIISSSLLDCQNGKGFQVA